MTEEQLRSLVQGLFEQLLEKLEVEDTVQSVYVSIDKDYAHVSVKLKEAKSKRGATWEVSESVDLD